MTTRGLLLATAVAMMIAPSAGAQPVTFTGVDGTISLEFPPGWRRLDLKFPQLMEPGTEFEADHGDAVMGKPGVVCTLKMAKQPLATNTSAAATNVSFRATKDTPLPTEPGEVKTITTRGPGVEIETRVLKGGRSDMVIWQAMYASGNTLYRPNMVCLPNIGKDGISAEQADSITAMTDAMRFHIVD